MWNATHINILMLRIFNSAAGSANRKHEPGPDSLFLIGSILSWTPFSRGSEQESKQPAVGEVYWASSSAK